LTGATIDRSTGGLLAKARSSVKKDDALPPELKQQAEMAKAL